MIPYGNTIGYPLILLSTLAHEMGHGLATIVVKLVTSTSSIFTPMLRELHIHPLGVILLVLSFL